MYPPMPKQPEVFTAGGRGGAAGGGCCCCSKAHAGTDAPPPMP